MQRSKFDATDSFDKKFGPPPASLVGRDAHDARALAMQFVVVFLIAYVVRPSVVHVPSTNTPSLPLCTIVGMLSVLATLAVHRSFRA